MIGTKGVSRYLMVLAAMLLVPALAADEERFADARAELIKELTAQGRHDPPPDSRGFDKRVLDVMGEVPRHRFVPEDLHDHAYDNAPLPIGHGQTISQPYIVALMTDLVDPQPDDVVLEIGTGSGYQTAVLAPLCRRVYTIERHRSLLREAEQRFKALRLTNITSRAGDGAKGWPEQAPFERVVATAAAPEIPKTLVDQLAPKGIMIVPVGQSTNDQYIMRIKRGEDDKITTKRLIAVRFVPLVSGTASEE